LVCSGINGCRNQRMLAPTRISTSRALAGLLKNCGFVSGFDFGRTVLEERWALVTV
jgi:hypothetical protein